MDDRSSSYSDYSASSTDSNEECDEESERSKDSHCKGGGYVSFEEPCVVKAHAVVSLSVHVAEPSSRDGSYERCDMPERTHGLLAKKLQNLRVTILQSVVRIAPLWVKSNRVQRLQIDASNRHQALSGFLQ